MTPEQLARARAQFPKLDERLWFNYGGGGPVPRVVAERMADVALALVDDPWDWPERYVADRDALRASIGRLVACGPESVALVRSTAHGLSLVAGGLDWRPGDNIVVPRWEFPSNIYPWLALGDRGVDVRMVETVDGRARPEDLLAACDDRTRVVAISLVQFWNGFRTDVATLAAGCRDRGIYTIVDAIQAVGAVDIDVAELGCDLLTAGAVKWMLGPAGIGFAYVGDRLRDALRPITVGLGSVADPTRIFDPELAWGGTARKFEESATAWAPIAGMGAAVDFLLSLGVPSIEARIVATTQRIGAQLAERGWRMVEPWPRGDREASGLIAFYADDPENVLDRLDAVGILARTYNGTVRLSPPFYVTDDEVDRALDAIGAPGT